MDLNGIDMSVVWAMRQKDDYANANRFILSAWKKHPDRLIPFARLNPWLDGSARQFLRMVRQGMMGLKLHPADEGFDPDDAIVHPLMEIAEKARIPVAFHTGGGSARPTLVGKVADRFPKVRVILLHLSEHSDSMFVAMKCENVFLETSQSLYLHRIARDLVRVVGADRVIWGSDAPYHPQEIEKRKIELAGLTDSELDLIMGGNILRILKGRT